MRIVDRGVQREASAPLPRHDHEGLLETAPDSDASLARRGPPIFALLCGLTIPLFLPVDDACALLGGGSEGFLGTFEQYYGRHLAMEKYQAGGG